MTSADARGERWSLEARVWLLALLGLALLLRVGVLLALPSIHHADEIYQALEQAYRLVTGHGVVPWEFRDGIRSWILPGALGLPVGLGVALSGDPAVPPLLAGIALAALSLTIVAAAFTAGLRLGLAHAVVAGFVAATWFELVDHGGRALTEVVATAPLLAALALAGRPRLDRRALLGIGLLLGCVVGLRFHLAPGVVVIGAWLAWRHGRAVLAPLVIGAAVPLVIVGVVDWVTWGVPYTSILRNLQVNLLEGKAAAFGTSPPWEYARMLLGAWWVALPLILGLALAGARRLPLWLWTALAIVLTHSLIGHKEARFIVPAVAIGVILAAIGSVEVVGWVARRRPASHLVVPLGLAVVLIGWTAASVGLAMRPGTRDRWTDRADGFTAFHWLHDVPELCGVGLQDLGWFAVPGTIHLGRDVPVLASVDAPLDLATVNALVERAPADAPGPGWREAGTFGDPETGIVVWLRDGECGPG